MQAEPAMMPHCQREGQFELFECTAHHAERAPKLALPFQQRDAIDPRRVGSILGVSRDVVDRLLEAKLLSAYQIGGGGRSVRIFYDSVVDYCNRLRVHYCISEDRLLRKPQRGRLRDADLLPFPLAQTISARDVQERLDISRANVISLIQQGDLVGYQVMIDTKASPYRIFAPSLERYIASLHIQAQSKLPAPRF